MSPSPEALTLEEAAERYGFPLRQLRRRVATGRLPGAFRVATPHGEEWRVSAQVMESLGYRRFGGGPNRESAREAALQEPDRPVEIDHAAQTRSRAEQLPDPQSPIDLEESATTAGERQSLEDGQRTLADAQSEFGREAGASRLSAERREALLAEREAVLDSRQQTLTEREQRLTERERQVMAREAQLDTLAAELEARELAAAQRWEAAKNAVAGLAQEREKLEAGRQALGASSVFVRAAEQSLEQERQALEAERARLQEMADRVALERLEWADERGRRGAGRSERVEAP